MTTHTRIEICGGLASGKTTLCQLLGTVGIATAIENFRANPFWSAFYEDPERYAFETEVTFLLQHYSQIKTFTTQEKIFSCDFSLVQDKAYAEMNLTNGRLAAFRSVYKHVKKELPPAGLLIHLKCDADEELKRIRNRGRAEEMTIQRSYLENINMSVSRIVKQLSRRIPIFSIDSAAVDFANDPKSRDNLVLNIFAAIET
jgi:deoxyguanosine kinase